MEKDYNDILFFMTGKKEIDVTIKFLNNYITDTRFICLPLYAGGSEIVNKIIANRKYL